MNKSIQKYIRENFSIIIKIAIIYAIGIIIGIKYYQNTKVGLKVLSFHILRGI